MAQHIVIRREQYVAGTKERPEVGVFCQTHATRPPVPWGKIEIGEQVWMKWTAGPIVARANVQGFRQIAECSAVQLRETVKGHRLYDLADYWAGLPPVFFGLTIYLDREQWLNAVVTPTSRSRGESWIVLKTPEKERQWLSPAGPTAEKSAPPRKARGRTRTISAALRFEVFRRDGFTCQYCGRRAPEVTLVADHVVPFRDGGETTLENLRAACVPCNAGKGARPLGDSR